MIIHHNEWGCNNIKHNCKTVEELIEKVIEKVENKEKKYFRICTKEYFEGKGNMLLYYQDGNLKSHHSTLVKFNYKDVLEYEIHPYYSMDDLKVENIISLKFDNIDDRDKELKKYLERHKSLRVDISRLNESTIDKMLRIDNEDKILDYISKDDSDNRKLEKAVQILIDRNQEKSDTIQSLVRLINEMYEDISVLKEQVKWLDR